jgi:hypothetical protein
MAVRNLAAYGLTPSNIWLTIHSCMTNDQIAERLAKQPNLSQVARDTGLPYRWIRHMKDNAIPEPGYEKKTRLVEWLLLQEAGKAKRR